MLAKACIRRRAAPPSSPGLCVGRAWCADAGPCRAVRQRGLGRTRIRPQECRCGGHQGGPDGVVNLPVEGLRRDVSTDGRRVMGRVRQECRPTSHQRAVRAIPGPAKSSIISAGLYDSTPCRVRFIGGPGVLPRTQPILPFRFHARFGARARRAPRAPRARRAWPCCARAPQAVDCDALTVAVMLSMRDQARASGNRRATRHGRARCRDRTRRDPRFSALLPPRNRAMVGEDRGAA